MLKWEGKRGNRGEAFYCNLLVRELTFSVRPNPFWETNSNPFTRALMTVTSQLVPLKRFYYHLIPLIWRPFFQQIRETIARPELFPEATHTLSFVESVVQLLRMWVSVCVCVCNWKYSNCTWQNRLAHESIFMVRTLPDNPKNSDLHFLLCCPRMVALVPQIMHVTLTLFSGWLNQELSFMGQG